jgi:hypothetical protein
MRRHDADRLGLAGVIGQLYARVGRAIDELLNEQGETNP